MRREGYHLLPIQARTERGKQMVRLFALGVPCVSIAEVVGLSYEGARGILRKAGRMGRLPRGKDA